MSRLKSVFILLAFTFVLVLFSTSKVYAGSYLFTTNADAQGCSAKVLVSVNETPDPNNQQGYIVKMGNSINVTLASNVTPNTPCVGLPITSMDVYLYWDNAIYLITGGGSFQSLYLSTTDAGPPLGTFTTPGGHALAVGATVRLGNGSGYDMGAFPFSFTVDAAAHITVNNGTCPAGTDWTTSNGISGIDTSTFTYTPPQSGYNMTISATPPVSATYNGSLPSSQMIFYNGVYSFNLDCTANAQPSVTLTSNPTNVSCSQPTATLTWNSVGAVSCGTINSGTQTGGTLSGSMPNLGGGLYQIQCKSASGQIGFDVVNNNPTNGNSCPGAGTISVTATPNTISSGNSSLIKWTTTNMASCSTDWWSNSTALNNSTGVSVSPLVTTQYTKSCTGLDGNNYSASAQVAVNPVASVTLLPASQTIVNGNSATLTWLGVNVSSCTGTAPSANWNSSSATSGNKPVFPSITTTYTITCVSSVGGADPTASAVVTVTGSGPDLTAGAASPTTATSLTNTNLTATISNIGGSSTGAGFSNFFQVATAANGGGTVTDLTSSAVPALASSGTVPATYNNYQFASAGTYSIRACADKTSSGNAGVITETNELNNCGAWTNVTVSNGGGSFDYSLSTPADVTVTKGGVSQPGQTTVNVSLVSGTPQPVTLSASGAPAGVSSSASTCFPSNPPCSSTITFSVPPSSSTGIFPITVTGSPLNHTTNFNLTIVPSTAIVVTCVPNPAVALVGNPVTWTGTRSGGSGVGYIYSWSGPGIPTSPAPSTLSFNQTYSTVGLKTAQLTVTDSLGNTGSCTPAGSVQINFNPQFKEF